MNAYYKLGSVYNGEEGAIEEDIKTFKGETELIIDLSDIAEGTFYLVKVIIDFNDGSPLFVKEYDILDHTKIVKEPIKHKYFPSFDTNFKLYYPTVYITYSNFKQFIYQIPLKLMKDSFYSSYKNLEVASCQFIDDENDSLFVNFYTLSGDILRLKIK